MLHWLPILLPLFFGHAGTAALPGIEALATAKSIHGAVIAINALTPAQRLALVRFGIKIAPDLKEIAKDTVRIAMSQQFYGCERMIQDIPTGPPMGFGGTYTGPTHHCED